MFSLELEIYVLKWFYKKLYFIKYQIIYVFKMKLQKFLIYIFPTTKVTKIGKVFV